MKTNFDGFVGEPPAFVGVGALAGNPGEAGAAHRTRAGYKGAVMAAQIIWRDHMGGPEFKLRCKGVKNIVVSDGGDWLDYDKRAGTPGQFGLGLPTNEGTIERPTAIITWETNWAVKNGSPSPLMPNGFTDEGNGLPNVDNLGTSGRGESTYSASSGGGGGFPDRMQLWEIRWALSEATLKAGGGTRVNTMRTTTANAPENTTPGAFDPPASAQLGNFPFPGCRIPIDHGSADPVLIYFTVVEYNIKERNAALKAALGFNNGKMILAGKNQWGIFGWASPFWPYPGLVPDYSTIGSQVNTKNINDQDWQNVKHNPDDITVVSFMIAGEP